MRKKNNLNGELIYDILGEGAKMPKANKSKLL